METLNIAIPSASLLDQGTPECIQLQSPVLTSQKSTSTKSTLTQLHQLSGPRNIQEESEGNQGLQRRQSLAPHQLEMRSSSPAFLDEKARLKVKRVIGTTATSNASFCCVGNFVAYTSGAGAVIAQLHEGSSLGNGSLDELVVSAERFFCTSPKMLQHYHQVSWITHAITLESSSASQQGPPSRDDNGFLLTGGITIKSMIDSIGMNTSNDLDGSGPTGGSANTSSPLRDRIKTTSCLSLSQDGKLLAVGETGYQPQVLVYSTAWNSSPGPLVMLSEHSYGVKLLCFSPCGRFLASLGNTNDGFLHIWSFHGLRDSGVAQLHSSNRCISVINDMKWSGSKLITAGRRHLRLWKIGNYSRGSGSGETSDNEYSPVLNDGRLSVLSGRNVILGDFSGSNFVSIVQISPGLLVVATDRGELATVEDPLDESSNSKTKFVPRLSVGFPVTTMDIDFHEHLLWVTGPSANDMK